MTFGMKICILLKIMFILHKIYFHFLMMHFIAPDLSPANIVNLEQLDYGTEFGD